MPDDGAIPARQLGLCNTHSALNLHLSNILAINQFHSSACYADDLLAYTVDWPSHLQQFDLALRTLHESDISCSPSKTEIGFAEVEYLVYRLSADALRISEKRIEAVRKIQVSKNVKALQRQLGMFNYLKKRVPDY